MQDLPKQEPLPLRVLLANKADVCQQLRAELQGLASVEIVDETYTDRQTLERFFELRPGVVILSTRLPEMGGFEVLRCIKRVVPGCTVILTSNQVNEFIQATASFLGAMGVCSIHDGVPELCGLLQQEMARRMKAPCDRRGDT
jgi:DNA-binding NarL/FixJ family response regulator